MASSSSDEEWGTAELKMALPNVSFREKKLRDVEYDDDDDDDDDWSAGGEQQEEDDDSDQGWQSKVDSKHSTDVARNASAQTRLIERYQYEGKPMILVDLTRLDPKIHNKFDKNGVNDSTAASALRKEIESKYEAYSGNSKLLAEGVVVPCGTTVWTSAIQRLRDDKPGHYWAPCFPPR
jgi:hypothetical protein